VGEYFKNLPETDTVLVVNSCARGHAVPESDLDFAILVNPDTTTDRINSVNDSWQTFFRANPTILQYKQSHVHAHLHLDLIQGNYIPAILEPGEPGDSFEIEIGNQICYSAPLDNAGPYFKELQHKWLPYYNETMRSERLDAIRNACQYDLDHIPKLTKRSLHFHAFDTLNKAFREYLQALFIAHRMYPIAYNKWIKEQIVNGLGKPGLYQKLLPILTISNMESDEMNGKAKMLYELLDELR
jgi:predicted nucleotidyltransferase